MAKFTPSPTGVAPSGYERPWMTFFVVFCVSGMRPFPRLSVAVRRFHVCGASSVKNALLLVDGRREDRAEPADIVRRQGKAVMIRGHQVRSAVFRSHKPVSRVDLR